MKVTTKEYRKLYLLLLAAVIVAGVTLLALAGGQGTVQNEGRPSAEPTKALAIHAFAGSQITPTPSPAMPGISIPGWTGMKIKAGQTVVSVPFYNPETNADWYYLTFQLKLKETNEVLFTTGLVPPGQYCNMVTLNRPMEAGEYEGILFVQPYLMRDYSITNNLEMPISIVVYN